MVSRYPDQSTTNKFPPSLLNNINNASSDHKADNNLGELSKELMGLYQDQGFSDFQLTCGTVTFPVHKVMLSARSPVFKRLLSSDMKEMGSGTVDIGDLDAPTLSRFLVFLYTGVLEELQSESALKLYYAADKYQVSGLKRECAEFLCANVSVSKVCDILSLADRHQDEQLRSVAHDLILKNYNEVLASEGWKGFMKTEPLLAVETLTHFAESKRVRGDDAPIPSSGFIHMKLRNIFRIFD